MQKFLGFLFIQSFWISALADTAFFTNGDRISGQISTMTESKLEFKTPYSTLTIPRSDIKNIVSSQAITVELGDGRQLKGQLIETASGPAIQNNNLNTPIPLSLTNIKAINPPVISDEAIVTGSAHLGGSKTTGNSKTQSIHADAKIVTRTANNKYTAGFEYNQAANDNQENKNNLQLYTQYDYYFLPKWYGLLYARFTKDRFQDLKLRSDFGAGIGHELWNSKTSLLSAELGIGYTSEDYDQAEDRDFLTGRWKVNYFYWLLPDRLKLFHNHTGLVNLNDVGDILFRSHTGLKLPVYNGFDFLAQIDWDHDTRPAAGKVKTDTRYIIGIGYNF